MGLKSSSPIPKSSPPSKPSAPNSRSYPPNPFARPGQSIAQRIEAVPLPQADASIRFRLAGKILEGMQIDGRGGEFRWTPSETHVGTHQLTIELHDPQTKTTVASAPLEVVVAPDRFDLPMPRLASQTATPGQTLRIPLYPDPPPRGLGQVFNLQLDTNGLPPGVSLENGGEVLVWKVPPDAAGSVKISLRPQLLIEGMRLPDNFQPSVVTITVGGPNTSAPANSPDPAAVAAAEKEIRELHSRELNSSSRRTTTLRQFLDKAIRQQPQAADLALLNIILNSEGGTKAADSIFDAAILRRQRYGSEIPPEIIQLCTQLKPGSLNSLQGDRLSEASLTLADIATAAERWTDVVEFLRIPIEFHKKGGRSTVFPDEYSENLTKAQKAAQKLSEGTASSADPLKQDIAGSLKSWKFQPVFRGPSGQGHFTFNAAPPGTTIPAAFLSSWTFKPELALLEGPASPYGFGFLDPAISGPHWVFRTQIASVPTSCRFVLGTPNGTTINGYQLILESHEFGYIKTLEADKNQSFPPTALPSGPAPRWNSPGALHDLEIRLHERELRVRIDGAVCVSTTLPKPLPGPAGFLVFMTNAADKPVIELRRPRFMRLP